MTNLPTTSDFVLIFFLLSFVSGLDAQEDAEQSRYELYDHVVGRDNTGLFEGPQFIDKYLDAWDGSHIYLESSAYSNSTLMYRNQLYTNVPMRYDIYEDNVSIRSNDHLSVFKIKLAQENISRFSVHNRSFIRLDNPGPGLSNQIFYEIAAVGRTYSLFIKHEKKRKRETVDEVLQYRFLTENYYLIQFNKVYHVIRSHKDLIEKLPHRSVDIKNFYKENKSTYKVDPDSFMLKLVTFLDSTNS